MEAKVRTDDVEAALARRGVRRRRERAAALVANMMVMIFYDTILFFCCRQGERGNERLPLFWASPNLFSKKTKKTKKILED
jgi:hypothetical protein